MSLFSGNHPGLAVQPPNIFKSEIKKQLGFSIDSIVGKSEVSSRPGSRSPVSPTPRSTWSPQSPAPSSSPPLHADIKQERHRDRSRSPLRGRRSVSPPTRHTPPSPASPPSSLYRPTPASLASSPALAQALLQDQLASLKAFYEAKGQSSPVPGLPTNPLIPPGLALPSSLPGFPRPPSSLPPAFLGLPGAHLPGNPLGHQPPHGVPREFPLHPWIINRHRFPLGMYPL